MAKVLVTGGAGFIGGHLTRKLCELGHEVTVLDNLFTGRMENIEGLPIKFINQDVREEIPGTYDWIFSLACPASPPHYQKDPIFTLTTCIDGLRRVIECAQRVPNCRILHASTSEIYGDPEVPVQCEKYRGKVHTLGIRSCYDEGKRAAEALAMSAHLLHGTDIRLVRIFNTYGPGMDLADGRVVTNFVLQALKSEPITMYGDGTQTRSFQYVDDLIRGFMAFIEAPTEKVQAFAKAHEEGLPVLNMGREIEFTMIELAEMILKDLPESKSELQFHPLPQDDPLRRHPDTRWAKELLGWQAEIPLQDGVKKMIEDIKKRIV